MADVVDSATRSRMMAGIRAKDTTPEMKLRRRLHASGLRFRLHATGLPGRPDIILPSRRAAIFVHGCFWHRHQGCHWCTTPASNTGFWSTKFDRNMVRDAEAILSLHIAGWRVATVWECGLRAAIVDETVDQVVAWVRTGTGDYESGLVRSRLDRASDAC
jgi:DNA mismatch endonuclease, patch repair protein